MTLIYDKTIFQAFRALAITDAKDLVIGQTYYHGQGGSFTIKALQTNKEHYIWWKEQAGVDIGIDDADDTIPAWWITSANASGSLQDHNIGASYNPCLIFSNENLTKACAEILKVTFEAEYDDPDYEDYYYETFQSEGW